MQHQLCGLLHRASDSLTEAHWKLRGPGIVVEWLPPCLQEVQALRHNSVTDSTGLRHSSLPDLSVMRSNSLGSPMTSGLRPHSSMGGHGRYNSLAGYGPPPQLLTELHAQRSPELRDSFFWTHLQGQQVDPSSSPGRQPGNALNGNAGDY